jgi:hypothetical protein
MQGHQNQAKPDQHPAEVAWAGGCAAEHDEPDQDEGRRDLGDIERQHLHDQRGTDIGAEHHGKRRNQVHQAAGREAGHHQPGCRAALQDRRRAYAGQECGQAIAERIAEEASELRAEGPLHTRLDHVDAPEQERHRPGQAHESDGNFHPVLSSWQSRARYLFRGLLPSEIGRWRQSAFDRGLFSAP